MDGWRMMMVVRRGRARMRGWREEEDDGGSGRE